MKSTLGVLLLAMAVAGCSQQKKSAPPHVVVIVMDTVRQDHLSCYGYDRPTTPNLDALAKKSRLYLNAYSTSGWTPPSHASLFTGQFAITHETTQERPILQLSRQTMAEILVDNGYHTVGISENPMLMKSRGFAQGFAQYHETWLLPEAEENHAVSLVRQTLADRDPDQPLHLFLNFIAPHSPYDSSREYLTRFLTDTDLDLVNNQWPAFILGEVEFSEGELQHLRDLYDAEILYTDHLVGQVIDALKAGGLWEDTVFIVTSDHGENFGDHDLVDHVFSLHQTTTRIPLIVHHPETYEPGSREEAPVQLTDILPTVLGLAGIDATPYPIQGVDLTTLDSSRPRAIFTEYYYPRQALQLFTEEQLKNPRLEPYKRRLASVILADYKYIWEAMGGTNCTTSLRTPMRFEI